MTTDKVLAAIKRLRVETGSLACLGCGHEHDCGIHGCAILREAANLIERLEKEKAALLVYAKSRCDTCKNFSGSGMRKRCWATWECQQCNIECSCRGCRNGSKWEWKGLEDV